MFGYGGAFAPRSRYASDEPPSDGKGGGAGAAKVTNLPRRDFTDYWTERIKSSLPENIDYTKINTLDDMNALRDPAHKALSDSDMKALAERNPNTDISTVDPSTLAANQATGPDAQVLELRNRATPETATGAPEASPAPWDEPQGMNTGANWTEPAMPWEGSLGTKWPEGFDPAVPGGRWNPEVGWLPSMGGALPYVAAGAQILEQLTEQGNQKFDAWTQQANSAEQGMQEVTADESQRGSSGPATDTQGEAQAGSDTNGNQYIDWPDVVASPATPQPPQAPDAVDSLPNFDQWGIPPAQPGNSGEVPYNDPIQSGVVQGYTTSFVPNSGQNTGVTGETGSGGAFDPGGGYDPGADFTASDYGYGGSGPHTAGDFFEQEMN